MYISVFGTHFAFPVFFPKVVFVIHRIIVLCPTNTILFSFLLVLMSVYCLSDRQYICLFVRLSMCLFLSCRLIRSYGNFVLAQNNTAFLWFCYCIFNFTSNVKFSLLHVSLKHDIFTMIHLKIYEESCLELILGSIFP